ncbi:peptidoglycan DD-metalloendopeptidase family protein [Bacillaceae bacterium Marseille-Q3522]|nr:peptidoglycan DD-metalloendopeptidase family protein [Bacillaceae bacterium Marseille-Q3522]
MRDYIKRFTIAGIMALCVSLLFLGGKHSQANVQIKDTTSHWSWPSNGMITDTFATRSGNHKGIDIAGEAGSPVFAVDKGVVTKSYYSYSYGNVIFIKHDYQIETVYAHLQNRLVEEGTQIEQGAIIGKMGSTGNSTGVHLHFEIHVTEWNHRKTNAVDPAVAFGNISKGEMVQAIFAKNEQPLQQAEAKLAEEEAVVLETENNLENSEKVLEKTEDSLKEYLNPLMPRLLITEIKDYESIKFFKERKEKEKNQFVHLVKEGESLWTIAETYNATVASIMKENNLENPTIVANQEIKIVPVKENQYIVKEGDSLSSIAAQFNVSVANLTEWNGLSTEMVVTQQVLQVRP